MLTFFDQNVFFVALDQRRRKYGMSWRDVSEATGVSPATLSRMSNGGGISAHTLVRLLSWTGSTDVYPFITAIQE